MFNRESVKAELKAGGVHYVFMGKELGGRPSDPLCYEAGRASYSKMAQTDLFQAGVQRIVDGSARHRIALMCSEADPLNCHRALLIGRSLAESGLEVAHIQRDGRIETHREAEARLIRTVGLSADLLRTRDEVLAEAYALQASRVAYVERPTSTEVRA